MSRNETVAKLIASALKAKGLAGCVARPFKSNPARECGSTILIGAKTMPAKRRNVNFSWMKWFMQDYAQRTDGMSVEQRALYVELLNMVWSGTPIPKSQVDGAHRTRFHPRAYKRVMAELVSRGTVVIEDGLFRLPKAERDIEATLGFLPDPFGRPLGWREERLVAIGGCNPSRDNNVESGAQDVHSRVQAVRSGVNAAIPDNSTENSAIPYSHNFDVFSGSPLSTMPGSELSVSESSFQGISTFERRVCTRASAAVSAPPHDEPHPPDGGGLDPADPGPSDADLIYADVWDPEA